MHTPLKADTPEENMFLTEYLTYTNSRFGFRINLPSNDNDIALNWLRDPPHYANDGAVFSLVNSEIEIRAWASYFYFDDWLDVKSSLLETHRMLEDVITYSRLTNNALELSGQTKEGHLFYTHAQGGKDCLGDEILITLNATYVIEQEWFKSFLNPIVDSIKDCDVNDTNSYH